MKKVYILVCVNLQNMQETALFSGKICTTDKIFTRPPVATNSKSVETAVLSTKIQALNQSIQLRKFPLGNEKDNDIHNCIKSYMFFVIIYGSGSGNIQCY